MRKSGTRLVKVCDVCEEAVPAICSINVIVSGFGPRSDRKQATTAALRCCRKCARALASSVTRAVGRTGLHTALDEVIG